MRPRDAHARAAALAASPSPANATAPTPAQVVAASPAASARPGGAPPASPPNSVLGDEKKILMILCTRVKQEAEGAIGEANLPGIDRPYKQAIAEIDKGRGVEAVRDLIRATEKAISSIRGPAIMRAFQEKMSLVMQPKV